MSRHLPKSRRTPTVVRTTNDDHLTPMSTPNRGATLQRSIRTVTALALAAAAVLATSAPASASGRHPSSASKRHTGVSTGAVLNAAEAAPTWNLTVNVNYTTADSGPVGVTISRLTQTTAVGAEFTDPPTGITLQPGGAGYTQTRVINENQGDVEVLKICAERDPVVRCTLFGFFFDAGSPFTSAWFVQAWGPGNDASLNRINYIPFADFAIGEEATVTPYASGARTLQIDISS
jgi:hypothetical protein